MGQKTIRSKRYCQNKCGSKTIGPKKFWVQKFWVQKNFGSKKALGQKKIWSKQMLFRNDFGAGKILGRQILGSNIFWVSKLWVKKNVGLEISLKYFFTSGSFKVKKSFQWEKNIVKENFKQIRVKKNWGPRIVGLKIYYFQKLLGQKNLGFRFSGSKRSRIQKSFRFGKLLSWNKS